VINGIVMEIQGICDHFIQQYEDTEIFITGGDGIFFAEGIKNTIFADPYLTLKGLNKILLFNEK
jgi:type III pantothenate kinase